MRGFETRIQKLEYYKRMVVGRPMSDIELENRIATVFGQLKHDTVKPKDLVTAKEVFRMLSGAADPDNEVLNYFREAIAEGEMRLARACAAHTAAFPAGESPALGVVCSPR